MRTVMAVLTVDVDISDDETYDEIQADARAVMIDLLSQGATIHIEKED